MPETERKRHPMTSLPDCITGSWIPCCLMPAGGLSFLLSLFFMLPVIPLLINIFGLIENYLSDAIENKVAAVV